MAATIAAEDQMEDAHLDLLCMAPELREPLQVCVFMCVCTPSAKCLCHRCVTRRAG